jgi:hypothetical protein
MKKEQVEEKLQIWIVGSWNNCVKLYNLQRANQSLFSPISWYIRFKLELWLGMVDMGRQ